MSEWKPIETAPKNGEVILICLSGENKEPDMVYYENSKWKLCYGGLYIDDTYHYSDQSNLFWMKLPTPPTKEKHYCENNTLRCQSIDGNLELLVKETHLSWMPHGKVNVCPICGEKA
jgi:hypothetical protein